MTNIKIDKRIENKPNYFSVIPATVRYDNRLCPHAVLLFSEITALCNVEGFCWATNNYFATLYKVKKMSVSRWIKQLIDYGYIKSVIEYNKDTKQVIRRKLFLNINPFSVSENITLEENITPMDKNVHTPVYKNVDTPIYKNVYTPIYKNVEDNNTSINNTSNNKKERKEDLNDNSFLKRENENEIKKISAEKNSTEKKKISFDEIIENYTPNEELRTELKEHLRVRKAKRAALTDHALNLSLKKLDSIANSDEERIEIVQNAIMSGWTAFYPLRAVKTNSVFRSSNYNINSYEQTMDVFDAQVKKEEERRKAKAEARAKVIELAKKEHEENVRKYDEKYAQELEECEDLEEYELTKNDFNRLLAKGFLLDGTRPPDPKNPKHDLFESPEEEARVIAFALSGAHRH